MGKRQIGDLQPGELVITILISEIAAIPIQDPNQPVLNGVVAVFSLVFLEILISIIAMKYSHLRRFFYGTSAIIIKDGIIDQKKLKSLRITGPDLLEVLRNRDIFDINSIAYAIFETNGQLSVLLKPEYKNATSGDVLGLEQSPDKPYLVISDGKFLKDEMKYCKVKKSKIHSVLKRENTDIKDVFLMTCNDNFDYFIIKKEEK